MQSAMSPGTKSGAGDSPALPGRGRAKNKEEVILRLVVEDPFSSIGELADQAVGEAPHFDFDWWTVFAILRRKRLLTRRARFRLARRKSR